jgi:hypothetical protein
MAQQTTTLRAAVRRCALRLGDLREVHNQDVPGDDYPLSDNVWYRVTRLGRTITETRIVPTQSWRDRISNAIKEGRS